MFAIKTITHMGVTAIIKSGFDRHSAAQKAISDPDIHKIVIRFGYKPFIGSV